MAVISSLNVIADTSNAPWNVDIAPFQITDQIYYVGNAWVGAYLIVTTEGLILLDTMCAETAYLLVDHIYRLGFSPRDLKIILVSHAHVDHFGGAQMLKKLSGAQLWLSEEDDLFRFDERAANAAASKPGDIIMRPYPFDVDQHYSDTEPIVLGDVTIRTKLTPGHTPGVTTFFITAKQSNDELLTAAMHGGVGVLTMQNAYFEESGQPRSLRTRFIQDCKTMEDATVDICLPSHPAHYPGDFFELSRQTAADGNPFVDKTAWKRFLVQRAKPAQDMENGI